MKADAKTLFDRGAAELGLTLTPADMGKFAAFADELKKWNRKINLTAIKDDTDIVVKHFLDSLTILKAVKGEGSLLDIGSGGGFPAIPVKLASPSLEVVSVDAVEKKILFQRHAARVLDLQGFEAIHARAEELSGGYVNRFNWVVSRAFSDIPSFAAVALSFLAEGGKVVAMKGKGGSEEAAAAMPVILKMGLHVTDLIEFTLPVSGDSRCLVVIERVKG